MFLISLLAFTLCSAQKTPYLFFADPTMSVGIFMEKINDSVKYEIHCKNISSENIYIPTYIRSQVYSPTLDKVYITWTSGDTDTEKIKMHILSPNEEHIYYTCSFPYTPFVYVGACYIEISNLAEYSDQPTLDISKMLFSDMAKEIVGAYGKW